MSLPPLTLVLFMSPLPGVPFTTAKTDHVLSDVILPKNGGDADFSNFSKQRENIYYKEWESLGRELE